jgi:holdfast attachment protein HfaA
MAAFISRLRPPLLALTGVLAVAGAASAQTMNANSASYNSGWGRTADQENQPINPSLRDPNGNLVVVNGVITSSQFSGGASSSASGASVGGATAIGNSLSVVTEGNYNVVVVDSRQTNNGTVTATTTTSGAGGNGQ